MVDTKHMLNIDDLPSSGIEYIDELKELSKEVIIFVGGLIWCNRIVDVKFDRGWGYIMAVFYVTIERTSKNIPSQLWVVVGDLPPAYIDVDDNPNGACAIDSYVMEMEN